MTARDRAGAPLRVLVYGYYGFRNSGDEAILAGIVRAFREVVPDTQFVVVSGRAAETRRLHGVEAVSRNRIRQIWRAMGRVDLVLAGGGSLLQDVTGLKSIPYYLALAVMGMLRRRPVVFHAQGVGPIRRWPGQLLTRLVASRVRLITVRDPDSAELLSQLGVRGPRIEVTGDAALVLPPGDPERGRALLGRVGVAVAALGQARPLIGVAIRPWPGDDTAGPVPHGAVGVSAPRAALAPIHTGSPEVASPSPAWRALAAALDQLSRDTGAGVVFLPLQPPADVRVARTVTALMETAAQVAEGEDWTYRELLDVIAACDLVVGMRYHALLFAAMAGVPIVGISYDPKIDALLRQLGVEPAARGPALDPTCLVGAAVTALRARQAESERLRIVTAHLAAQARLGIRLALDLTRRRR